MTANESLPVGVPSQPGNKADVQKAVDPASDDGVGLQRRMGRRALFGRGTEIGIGLAGAGILVVLGLGAYEVHKLTKKKDNLTPPPNPKGTPAQAAGGEPAPVPTEEPPKKDGPTQFNFLAEASVPPLDFEYIKETTLKARDYFHDQLGVYPQTLTGEPFSVKVINSTGGTTRGGQASPRTGFSIDVGSQIWKTPDGGNNLEIRRRLPAHELFHLVEAQLADKIPASPLWLFEGAAEWASYKFINDLGISNLKDTVAMWTRIVKGQSLSPTISEIPPGGSYPTYPAYFLAVNRLVGERGLDAIAEFYKKLSGSGTPHNAFESTFGISLNAFEAQPVI